VTKIKKRKQRVFTSMACVTPVNQLQDWELSNSVYYNRRSGSQTKSTGL